MESADFDTALALLEWQVELGATEAIGDAPVDCYALPATLGKPKATAAVAAATPARAEVDPVAEARAAAAAAVDLPGLAAALGVFEHCALKRGASNLVFSDGTPGARVMIVGEAPGRDEDLAGKPFVGRAGQLLDRMLAAIDMGRATAEAPVYITNVLPWRPPRNRDPQPEEIAMMRPFLERHIALANPQVIVIMGNISAQALLGKRGITRLRGSWTEAQGRPALPMFHPAYLLRQPAAKRDAWSDLLSLKARLGTG
ncbi:uracil-DNA glycosylase [uncultured Roseobacter sp.]|uniref:uracil-DNA glycosylase n=1 Tax=uncultured Roseobacter sp. TaxID=114847 RepID=UPI002629F42D|nr:uracil-DNA glycosylase [uncultured Roseobacter sp.]